MAKQTAKSTTKIDPEKELAEEMAQFALDPMGFVMFAFPWGKDPSYSLVELKEPWKSRYNSKYGPDEWSCQFFEDLGKEVRKNNFDGKRAVPAIRRAVASGHGIGKTFTTGLLTYWIMSCHPLCRGTITATTMGQLESKTWAEISAMRRDCITGHWFECTTGKNSMRLFHKDYKDTWFCTAQTCREENSEAFAGQHAADSTSFYIFDEASGVPDKIWEVAEGGLTDGEPMFFAFGNPTKNTGSFYNCFHKDAGRWKTYKVDSRSVQLTNKKSIQEWADVYGEDSDFFKIRVRGEFPNASSSQFIPTSDVDRAMAREDVGYDIGVIDQALLGLDVARFGDDVSVLFTRIGRDARTFPVQEFRDADGPILGSRTVSHAKYLLDIVGFRTVHLFFDRAGVGAAVWDYFRYNVSDARIRMHPVDFGQKATNANLFLNKRVEMWHAMRSWLAKEGVLPVDEQLKTELISPYYQFTDKEQFQLERKKDLKARIGCSPDHADALALTFAEPFVEVSEKARLANAKNIYKSRNADPLLALDTPRHATQRFNYGRSR